MSSHYYLLALPLTLSAMAPEETAVMQRSHIPDNHTVITYDESDFFVTTPETGTCKVHSYDLDPLLQKIPKEKLQDFLQVGYLVPKKLDNGDFKIDAKVRGNGGGIITAYIMYGAVKGVGYGAPLLASAAAAVGVAKGDVSVEDATKVAATGGAAAATGAAATGATAATAAASYAATVEATAMAAFYVGMTSTII